MNDVLPGVVVVGGDNVYDVQHAAWCVCNVGEKEEEKDGAIYVEYSRDH